MGGKPWGHQIMAKTELNLRVDTRRLKARLRVASFCAHIVYWLPMSMVKKHAAANWLLDWAMQPGVKVEVD